MTLADVPRPSPAYVTMEHGGTITMRGGDRLSEVMSHHQSAARTRTATFALNTESASSLAAPLAQPRGNNPITTTTATLPVPPVHSPAQRRAILRQHEQLSSARTATAAADMQQGRESYRRLQQQQYQQHQQDNDNEELRHRRRQDDFARARRQAHEDLEAQHQLWARHVQQQRQRVTTAVQQTSLSSATPPPPTSQHRVYLIDCRSCGSFLTDRGMKAVLLLRPHITLYSTDAMPNCGPLHAPSRLAEPSAPHEPVVERTCDCLTQTLGCYGCGSAVGYHIVSPCDRCTSSVAKHQRSSNGHRTVLHCAEITVRERRYVPGEPGVRVTPSYMAWMPTMPQAQSSVSATSSATRTGQQSLQHPSYRRRAASIRQYTSTRSASMSQVIQDEYEDDDGEDYDEDEDDDEDEYDDDDAMDDEFIDSQDKALRDEQQLQHRGSNGDMRVSPTTILPQHPYRALRRGDTVYWSDLIPGGERATPIDSDDCLSMPVAGR